jgi:phage terminase large subunit GpA-like protein
VVIDGSPRERAPWEALAKLLAKDWPRIGNVTAAATNASVTASANTTATATGAMRIAKICVDTGGRDTASVYGHLRHLRDPRIAPTKGVEGWNRAQPVQGPTLVDALVNGQKLRRGLKLWTVSVSTWKADLYRRMWLGRGDGDADAGTFPAGWVHLPSGIEVEWVKQLVAEQLRTSTDRRGFARQEWAKLRERNEALDCAVLARAALWLLGADRYGDRYWQRLRTEVEDAGLAGAIVADPGAATKLSDAPATPNAAVPNGETLRPRAWLGARGGWLR